MYIHCTSLVVGEFIAQLVWMYNISNLRLRETLLGGQGSIIDRKGKAQRRFGCH
jgi:hypothetical protein